MKRILTLAAIVLAVSGFGGIATEQYADAAAATAQTNAMQYADAHIAAMAAALDVDTKVNNVSNEFHVRVGNVNQKATQAKADATVAKSVANSAKATAIAASNVAATVSSDLSTERVQRQNKDAEHTAAIAAETAAREAADALLASQVAGAVSAVSNKADAASLAGEIAAREAADAALGTAVNAKASQDAFDTYKAGMANVLTSAFSRIDGKQNALVSGTNIKTINGQSVLGSGNIVIEGGGGGGTPDRGVWDAGLGVWWTPVMNNGKLTYQCTTNVNLNAGN